MATSLATQLARIAVKSTNALDLKAQKKAHSQSLLFDPQAAATQDFDTIYQICLEGYQELCRIDPRFIGFANNIFSEQSKREDRAQMTAAENTELDSVLERFLTLVGSRLLLKPAVKAVEWLVRRFRLEISYSEKTYSALIVNRVQENNIEALLLTFLPYHTLPNFTTLLSILPPTLPPTLKFLHPYKESLANPSRHTIVHTATHNLGFLLALNTYVLKSCRARNHYRGLLSFWAGIFTEAVSGMLDQSASRREAQARKEQDILLRVLPVLNEGLSTKSVPDLRVGCYMVLTILTSRVQLNDHVLEAMMEAVVSHWTIDTTHAGLICLSVLAQSKSTSKLPKKVYKAIVSIESIEDDLKMLGEQYPVENLTYGLICGMLDVIGKGHDAIHFEFIWSIIESNLAGKAYVSAVIENILLKAYDTGFMNSHGPDMQRRLANLLLKISDSEVSAEILRNIISKNKIDLELLEINLQASILQDRHLPSANGDGEDINLKDVARIKVGEDFTTAVGRIPTGTPNETSFLSHSKSYIFGSLCHAFLLASSSETCITQFCDLPVLRKSFASIEPLYISFFIRIWCGPYPLQARAASLNCIGNMFENAKISADLQILFPYIVYALGDMSPKIRRAATDLILRMTAGYTALENGEKGSEEKIILGKDSIYGHPNSVQDVSWMAFVDVTKFLRDLLVPNLEECRLDAAHIVRRLTSALSGSHHNRTSNFTPKELKTSTKLAIFTSLGSHVNQTPLHSVKLRLLSILNQLEKVGSVSRTKILAPLLTAQEKQSEGTLKDLCAYEHVSESDYLLQIVSVVSPSDREGLHLLLSLVLPRKPSLSQQLRKTAFQRIHDVWKSIKPDIQLLFGDSLLDFAVKLPTDSSEEEFKVQALEILRSVSLSGNTLLAMLEKLPNLSDRSNDEPPPKRRRMSQEVARGPIDANLANKLKITTTVLELVEANKMAKISLLLKGLFQILADTQHAKVQMQVDLGYIQALVLDSLSAIIEQEKVRYLTRGISRCLHIQMSPSLQLDNSSIRVDLVVNCVRTTFTPQVQRAALLLMSSLASLVPDVVVHSVMPIFTFMGSTILRLNDEYSAHVIDKVKSILNIDQMLIL